MMNRRLRPTTQIQGVLLFLVALPVMLMAGWTRSSAAEIRPNIVVVLVDDMQRSLVSSMPNVKALAQRGLSFQNARSQVALCTPSRSTLLTGRYAQNTHVYTNAHRLFYEAGNPERTIAVWLSAAGYRTALFGKYLNGYPYPNKTSYVPPGWSTWAGRIAAENGDEPYNYRLIEDGIVKSYGAAEADYATDVYFGKALSFIDAAIAAKAPFFVLVSVHAPHDPATPAPRHLGLFSKAAMPRPPSFNEADVSDKPQFLQSTAPLDAATLQNARRNYRDRLRSLRAVDEGLWSVVKRLRSRKVLDRTYVVFLTDNGLLFGEHRVMRDKGGPYEEANDLSLVIRGPGVPAGGRREHLVANVDLAPTILDWAAVTPPPDLDGRSLVPLLRTDPPDPEQWRQSMPLTLVRNSSAPVWPTFYGVRTRDFTYAHYDTGDRELYDLRVDPYELQNIVNLASPDFVARLDEQALELNGCGASQCRALEDLSIVP